jgi:hypothetical protein
MTSPHLPSFCRMDDPLIQVALLMLLEELRMSMLEPVGIDSDEELESLPSDHPEPSSTNSRRGGESGAEYVHRLLSNENACHVELRLERNMFVQLVQLMRTRNLLEDGRFVKIPQQVAICLYILSKGVGYRDVGTRFTCSPTTIGNYFLKVLDALRILSYDIVRPHRDLNEAPPEVTNDTRYWPFFVVSFSTLLPQMID